MLVLDELFADFAAIYDPTNKNVREMDDQEYLEYVVNDRVQSELKSFHKKILWSVLMYLFNNSDCTKMDVYHHIEKIKRDGVLRR